MNILQITDIKNPKGNGVAEAVKYYVKYENSIENAALFNLNKNLELDGLKEFNYDDYNKISSLPKPYNKPDIVVFNEVYKKKYLKLYKECLKNKIPYVIIPHGCLVDVAQKNRKIKKAIGNIVFFNKFIKNASAIQFLNKEEKENTKFQYKNSIISGNGVDKFSNESTKPKSKDLIYIGRYSIYHKGLDMLVKVCVQNKEWFIDNNIKIKLYGRPTRKDLIELNKLIEENDINDVINVNGPIYGEDKINLLKESYGFIQTSRHEGQPMGIVEALAYGIPCIVTEGTNFKDFINKYECGYGVEFNEIQIFNAIKQLYLDDEYRNKQSVNAIENTKKYFKWDNIIKILIKKYRDLI